MATTKIWKIKSRFDNVIDYITNKDKTDNKKYVTSINCMADIAFKEMSITKQQFNKTGGILGLLSIAITLSLEYRSSKSDSLDTQFLKSDSLMLLKQDSLTRKVDLLINSSQSDLLNHNTPSKTKQ